MSVLWSLLRLCANRPAPTSSTSERLACRITSPSLQQGSSRRSRPSPAPQGIRTHCACAAIHAGATPNSTPVNSASTNANPTTVSDGLAWIGTVVAPRKCESCSSIRVPAYASPKPSRPPMQASSTLSVSSCRTMRPRIAPNALRTLISIRGVPYRAPAAGLQYSRRQSAAPAPTPTSADADARHTHLASPGFPLRPASAPHAPRPAKPSRQSRL